MQTSISIQHKKKFIQWFLNNFTLKKPEATWILKYIMKKDKLLSKMSFVNDAKFCPRAIILTSVCTDETPFLFYKKHLVTTDIDKFFHDIRLHQDEHFYIQLNFRKANQNPFYVGVLEENPFTPTETTLSKEDQIVSERLLDTLLQEYQLTMLKKGIDQALDEKNKEKFDTLVMEFQKLRKANNIL